jgi:Tfp pilus assembly protein PilF
MDGAIPMRRLNYKLFLCLVAALVVVTGLTFLVHWLQTGSISRALLARAERAEKQGQPHEAARYISRYLELQPDDNEQRARLGRTLAGDQFAGSPRTRQRAAFVLEEALRRDSDLHDLRFKLVRVYLDLGQPDKAREHLEVLQKSHAQNGEVAYLRGQLAEADQKWDDACARYQESIKYTPPQIEAYVRLAYVLRERSPDDRDGKKAAAAEQAMNDLVANNKNDYHAVLARWQYHKRWPGLEEAAKKYGQDVTEALRLAPTEVEPLLAGAELAQLKPDVAQARRLLEQGRRLYPQDGRLYRELALLELRQENEPKRRESALKWLRDGCNAVPNPNHGDLLWTLANVLLDGPNEDLDEAQRTIVLMARSNPAPASLDYLNARVQINRRNWAEAEKLLVRTRPFLESSPELRRQVDGYLAQCYAQLNDPARAAERYKEVLRQDPRSVPAHLAYASALAAQGQVDQALDVYRQLTKLEGAPPACWIEIARLLILRDSLRNQAARNNAGPKPPRDAVAAQQIDAALAEAKQRVETTKPQTDEEKARNTLTLTLLNAEVLAERGDVPAATKVLRDAVTAQPKKVELWAALALLTALPEVGNDRKTGEQILEQAATQIGKGLEPWLALQLAEVRFWLSCGGPDATAALQKIQNGAGAHFDKTTQERKAVLWHALAEAHYRLGNLKDATALWSQVADEMHRENDLTLQLLLFDLALQTGDVAAMQKRIDETKRIEGPNGALWQYASAARLIWQARQGKSDAAALDQARRYLDRVAALRQDWPTVHVALADLHELRGNQNEAIASYRNAFALGERNPRVVRQLVELLSRMQRFDEAQQEIQRLQGLVLDSDDSQYFLRKATDISLQNLDFPRAQALLLQTKINPNDYRDWLWQGQVLAASGLDGAEEKLRKAADLGAKEPETWIALVRFLARKDPKEAEKAIEEARPHLSKLPQEQAPLALGQCYDAANQPEKAEEQFAQCGQFKPDNQTKTNRVLASYYLRVNKLGPAEKQLRSLMNSPASPSDVAWARRELAMAVARRGDFNRLGEALSLVGLKREPSGKIVDGAAPKTDDPNEEARAQARVLGVQPLREMRSKAISILKDLEARRALLLDDQFLLAQLYDADGNRAAARDLFRQLAIPGKNALYVAHFAQVLVRLSDWNAADSYIKQLEELEKTRKVAEGEFGSKELRAQWYEGRGQGDEAIKLLSEYVERKETRPEKVFLLVNLLTRQKKYDEALTRCKEARTKVAPELVGGATVAVLRAMGAQPDAAQCGAIESWLQEESKKAPKSAYLYLHLADLRDLQRDYKKSQEYCSKALEQEQNNLVALNNLAWLLSQDGKAAEALTLINRAIEVGGPRAELLDTRATVQLALGRSDLALADLEAAQPEGQEPPTMLLRKAQAQKLAGNTQAAIDLLKKADAAKPGLKTLPLHPLEEANLKKLRDELNVH